MGREEGKGGEESKGQAGSREKKKVGVRKGSRMNLIWNNNSRSHACFTHEMHYSDRTKELFFFLFHCYFTPEMRGSRTRLGFTDYFFTVSYSVLTRHLLKLLF